MIKLDLKCIADILHAELIGDGTITVENISTDTRRQTENGLFFALQGEKFDAHAYLNAAVAQGCRAVVVQRRSEVAAAQLIVADTRLALGRLAQWLKAHLKPKTVAITGSSGKTSVKEMTASILRESAVDSEAVLFTHGNFNNDIGVPLTLLRLTERHRFAVIELGANHPGEIAYTTELVCPDAALVNNVAAAHLEGFGSIDGVAQAKGEIYRGLAAQGVAVINLDCHYLTRWQADIGAHQVRSFSADNAQADYYAADVHITENGSDFVLHSPQGQIAINLPYLGAHNISNALAATALAMSVGTGLADVKRGLERKSQVSGRLFPLTPCHNLLLLDDTYNANVASLRSAISVLQKYAAFRILVVGDMAELGENSQLCHQQVAEFARAARLEAVVSFGVQSAAVSAACGGTHFTDKAALTAYVTALIQDKLNADQKVVLLAKGSRSMRMEDVINSLKDNFVC
ncbi:MULTISPECIES: UDP-N-acetylmuramoyl-tripeptide--D-alanyl-D-alanine ligase [Pasteurellaceae]|uniref:UDP-N-acetylmuramoyl-tripeptide--D-alanyl-D- alanine ligase n=1 Tax=Pasteurellaceae TaxID=712 RepID=UPI00356875C4